MVYVKTFYCHFFTSPVNLLCKRIWIWNLNRNLTMAIYTVLFEKLYTILRWKKLARHKENNFSFKLFKIMRFLISLKCSKTIAELMFTTQKVNTCSSWTVYLFCIPWPFVINLFLSVLFQTFDDFWKQVPTKLMISLC